MYSSKKESKIRLMSFMRHVLLIIFSVLCVSSWVAGVWLSDVRVLDAPYYQPIFFQFNPLFWVSVILAVVIFTIVVLGKENNRMWFLSIFMFLLVLGVTPYLVELGKTYDAYMYYSFSLFIAKCGYIPQPQPGSSLVYFEWPGLLLLGATFALIIDISPEIIVKSFELVNLTLFVLGIFMMTRTIFQDVRKAALSGLLVFLGSSLTFYDFSPNWSTFSLVPLFVTTFLHRDRKWRITSLILFSYITVGHSFNPLIAILIVSAMYAGQRLFNNVSYHRLPRFIFSYITVFLVWNTFVGTFFVKKGLKLFIEALTIGSQTVTIRVTSFIVPLHTSEVIRRLILILIIVSVLWVFILKRSGRNMDRELIFCWPTLVMFGLTFVIPGIIKEPFFWGRTFAYTTLLGFPITASLLTRIGWGSIVKNSASEIKRVTIILLFVCMLLTSYVFSTCENEVAFTVPFAYMHGSKFLEPSLHEGSIVLITPTGDLYSTISNKLEEVTISTLSDESLAYSKWSDFIVIREKITEWFSTFDPDIGAKPGRIEHYVEHYRNRIYDNRYTQIYAQR